MTFNFGNIKSVKKTLSDAIFIFFAIFYLIPNWLIFDQSGSRKIAGFLKNQIAGKLSVYDVFFSFFFTLGLVAQIAFGRP